MWLELQSWELALPRLLVGSPKAFHVVTGYLGFPLNVVAEEELKCLHDRCQE